MTHATSFNFTIETINKLPIPAKGLASYKDTQNPALQLYVTPTGAKTFFFRKRIRGRDQRIKVGAFPNLSISQARSQIILLAAEVEKGLDPLAEKRKQTANARTLGEQCEIYIERYCKQRNKRWADRKKEIEKYLRPLLKAQLNSITREEVECLHMKIGERAPIMANRVMALLRSVFNYAIKKGWEGANPVLGVEWFRETSRDRFIQPEEIPFVLKAIEEETLTMKDFFLMLLLTGARKGDVQKMRWEQIDFDYCSWRIPETKNGQPLLLALTERAIEILKSRKENSDSPWVFPQKGRPTLCVVSPQKTWERIRARATIQMWKENPKWKTIVEEVKNLNLPTTQAKVKTTISKIQQSAEKQNVALPTGLLDVRIHDLRRTFASYQAMTGSSLQIIGKSLGHKSQQATQIYARLNLDPVRSSVEKAVETMFSY